MDAEHLPETISLPAGDYALIGQASRWQQMVDGYVVDSATMFEAAAEDLRTVKGIRKSLEDERTKMKAPILEAGRAIDAFFKRPISMLDDAAGVINRTMVGWKQEQDRIAREAQRKADEEAARIRAEAQKKALELAAQNKVDEAEKYQAVADVVISPKIEPRTPKVEGVHTRTTYSAELVDLGQLVEFIAANHKSNPQVLSYITANMSVLNKLASALKDSYAVPGTRAIKTESVVAR